MHLQTDDGRRAAILAAIKSGLAQACDDALLFSEDYSRELDAEYLLTVDISKEVFKLNPYIVAPELRVNLELTTADFATLCAPQVGYTPANNFMGRRTIWRTEHDVKCRPGKIDIVVIRRGKHWDMPVCAIEVKGFNPVKKTILDDLARNAEFFDISDPTGQSQIEFTAFAALHSYQAYSKVAEGSRIAGLKKRYRKYLPDLQLSEKLRTEIDAFPIRSALVRDGICNAELDDLDDRGHFFAGVILTFVKSTL